jgi:hypothetical protein
MRGSNPLRAIMITNLTEKKLFSLGTCDVCDEPAGCEWPMLDIRLCRNHMRSHAPPGAFDPPDDFDIPFSHG